MSDVKISALPAASALTGTEPVPGVQGGATVKILASAIAGLSAWFTSNTSAVSLANNNSAQNIFPATNDTFTAEANTAYFVRASITITHGSTSHNTSFGLAGTATYTSLAYHSIMTHGALGSPVTNTNQIRVATAAATVLGAAATTQASTTILINGIIRTNGVGTIIPQITFSADPTGTCQIEANSWLILQKVGADTVLSSGAWG